MVDLAKMTAAELLDCLETAEGVTVDGRTGPVEMRSPLKGYPGWRVVYTFGRSSNGAVAVAKMQVEQAKPAGPVSGEGVTVAMLRKVGMASVRHYLELNRPRLPAPPRRARVDSLTPAVYRRLLRRYTELIGKGDPAPAKTLARELGRNRATVRTWIARAKGL